MSQHIYQHKPIASVLERPKHQLAKLMDKVNHLRTLNQCLSEFLEPKIANYCQIANFQDGCLTIMAENSSCATRLRYMAPELNKKLQAKSQFRQLKSIRVIIQLNRKQVIARKPREKLNLTADNAQTLKSTANGIKDPGLKAALLRIAREER
jgi:hypothetical protein